MSKSERREYQRARMAILPARFRIHFSDCGFWSVLTLNLASSRYRPRSITARRMAKHYRICDLRLLQPLTNTVLVQSFRTLVLVKKASKIGRYNQPSKRYRIWPVDFSNASTGDDISVSLRTYNSWVSLSFTGPNAVGCSFRNFLFSEAASGATFWRNRWKTWNNPEKDLTFARSRFTFNLAELRSHSGLFHVFPRFLQNVAMRTVNKCQYVIRTRRSEIALQTTHIICWLR